MTTFAPDKGVSLLDNVSTDDQFLKLAAELGSPVSIGPEGYIKSLTVKTEEEAPANSLSAKYGKGSFPFHTDTAFWPRPARLVLLRALKGDIQRPTYVISFDELLTGVPNSLIKNSAWICDTGNRKFYTMMHFDADGRQCLRYDPNCMRGANRSAKTLESILTERCSQLNGCKITWKENRLAIISNWTHLHARGVGPDGEHQRILQRIYVN